MRGRWLGMLLAVGMIAAGAAAQTPQPGVPRSAVVVLDRDDLFTGSLFGRRAAADIEAASAALVAENGRIEAALEAEEQALTDRRPVMETAAFRDLAADFDTRVTDIRRAQDAKARAIQIQSDRAQAMFFEQANSVLVQLARETGALVILDRRTVIASADQVDITDLARRRIDAALGEGKSTSGTAPSEVPATRRDGPVAPVE